MPAPVKVEGGLVQGAVESNLTVYRGIPFAAPPVGDFRWRAPESAAKWEFFGIVIVCLVCYKIGKSLNIQIQDELAERQRNFASA